MFIISDVVKTALKNSEPVVALESTLITHGLPYPVNVETALSAEDIIRKEGCVPATIAILDGVIRIGLSEDEIGLLGRFDRKQVMKVSRAELPVVVAQKKNGGTTVAATMICARLAGISVFATGGLGGVHKGGETSMDISADMCELARTDVVVVCAGAKSILDIGRTLEALETQGVPVVGFGVKNFPAFHYRDSGYSVNTSVSNASEMADLIRAKRALGMSGGMLVGNPVPKADAMERSEVEGYVNQAVSEANTKGITGKEVTPFLLTRLNELSGGKSVACNVSLIKNNARVAAQIAKKLASPRGFEPLLLP
jgi:pseudouridine-5'-phosphate glycosidase